MFNTKEEAKEAASKALSSLPDNWSADIYENFGWHVVIHYGRISVHNSIDNKYYALISDTNDAWVGGKWTRNVKSFNTPAKAILAAIAELKSFVNDYRTILNNVEKNVVPIEIHGIKQRIYANGSTNCRPIHKRKRIKLRRASKRASSSGR